MTNYQSYLRYCRKFSFFLLALCVILSTINAIARAQVKSSEETQKHRQLYYLCKVWGYLQYYSPPPTNNANEWEYALRRHIKTILTASDANAELPSIDSVAWSLVRERGVRSNLPLKDMAVINHIGMISHTDFQWLRDTVFEKTTQRKLESLPAMYLPLQRPQHYVRVDESNRPVISALPNLFRTAISQVESLAALFIFWNAVNYMSPHKNRCSKNWDTLLVEYIPQFLRVTTNAEYVRVLMKFRAQLNDSHATLESPDLPSVVGNYRLPMQFIVLDSDVVIQKMLCCDSLNAQGWVVKEMNGAPIDSLIAIFSPFVAASNDAVHRREIARILRFSKHAEATLVISNGIEEKRISVACSQSSLRANQQFSEKNYYRAIETSTKDTIAYFDFGIIEKNDVPSVMQKLAEKRGAIFDLRKYPNPFVDGILLEHLNQPTAFGIMYVTDFSYPGYHAVTPPLLCGKKQEYVGNIVVLVNEWTQSSGEHMVLALQTIPNLKTVGSQTAGANGQDIKVILPLDVTVNFTMNALFDAKMQSLQGVGILPDIEVRPTIEGIRAGRDEVLEKGVEVLSGLLKKKE